MVDWKRKKPNVDRDASSAEVARYRQAELDAGKACGDGHAPKHVRPRGGGYRVDCSCGWKGLRYADEDPNAYLEWVAHIRTLGAHIVYPNGDTWKVKPPGYTSIT